MFLYTLWKRMEDQTKLHNTVWNTILNFSYHARGNTMSFHSVLNSMRTLMEKFFKISYFVLRFDELPADFNGMQR